MSQIFVGSDCISHAVSIFAKFTDSPEAPQVVLTETALEGQNEHGVSSLPTLVVTENGNQTLKTTSAFEIVQHLATASKFEAAFLGKTEELAKQVTAYFEEIPSLNKEELVEKLNTELNLRMFLVGYNITAADIFAYAHVAHLVHGMSDADKNKHNNLFRWARYLQQVDGISEFATKHNLVLAELVNTQKREIKNSKPKAAEAPKEDKKPKETNKQASKQQPVEEEKKQEQTEAPAVKEEAKQGKEKKEKKEKKPKQQNPPKNKAPQKKEELGEPITQLDIKIGRITKVWKHPDSEKLYCEEIDVGEEKPRQIASGLQQFIPIENMENAMVVVLANLKAKKLAGFLSQGMVLTAGNAEHTVIELLVPPEGSQPGDKVTIKGFDRNPPEVLNPKKMIFEAVAGDLRVDENGIAKFKDAEFVTEKGVVVSTGIRDGKIS